MTQQQTDGASKVIAAKISSPESKIVFLLFYNFNDFGEFVLGPESLVSDIGMIVFIILCEVRCR
jgi:hypothetical protein